MPHLLKIKTEKNLRLIALKSILYIEAFNKHSIIYLNDYKKIESNHPLKWIESQLGVPFFYRIHDSFIVNCYYFESINNRHVILQGDIKVPISRYKKQLFETNLEKYYNLIEELAFTSQ